MNQATTFINILKNQNRKIIIPMVQRDYAQGRKDSNAERIRNNFLEALYIAIADKPIILDFVYGEEKHIIHNKGTDQEQIENVLTLLDGQQRLTTLFLLHWYATKKEKIDKNDYAFLKNFSYETRPSSRDFCKKIIDFSPNFNKEELISKQIYNQFWFPASWKKDPTIASMLTMLDAIHEKFSQVENIWNKLVVGNIKFYFLPIEDMGLTDDLYIKMNSRGKMLTDFENFKAELDRKLKKVNPTSAERIMRKVDSDWTDMLWPYRNADNIIDDGFLNFFDFIYKIILYKNNDTPYGKQINDLDKIEVIFPENNPEKCHENSDLIERFFDAYANLPEKYGTVRNFFTNFISDKGHQTGKIRFSSSSHRIDLFEDCVSELTLKLPKLIELYAFTVFLLNSQEISEEQFGDRIRIVNNLVQNSEDEISDNPNRDGGNRMPAIIRQVDNIIIQGIIDTNESISFNKYQISEEIAKISWKKEHPNACETLFELEDHELLYGQIGIIGLGNPQNFTKFIQLFNCDQSLINCAMLATGDYGQPESNHINQYQYAAFGEHYQKSWQALFHKNRYRDSEPTKQILNSLLSSMANFTDNTLEEIVKKYLTECEAKSIFDWRYYYLKYSSFRPQEYWGKFVFYNPKKYQSLVVVSKTRCSENAYDPYLAAVGYNYLTNFSHKDCLRLPGANQYINSDDSSFVQFEYNDGNLEKYIVKRIPIAQKDNYGTENRIEKLKNILQELAPKADFIPYSELASNSNLPSTSKRYFDQKMFHDQSAKSNENILQIYHQLYDFCTSLSPEVSVYTTKNYVAFALNTIFLEFHFQKDHAVTYLANTEYNDPLHKTKKLSDTYEVWSKNTRLEIYPNDDMDYIKNIVKQSFDSLNTNI